MESGSSFHMVILNNSAGILVIIFHGDHTNGHEMYVSVRMHPVFVTCENLSIVLQPFDFNKRLIGFTFIGHNGVLLFSVIIFQFLSEGNNLLS